MPSIFEILFLIGNPGKISKGEKVFLRGNLICYISGTEGCRKLKLGEVGLQICQNFWRKIEQKHFRPECPFKRLQFRGGCLTRRSEILVTSQSPVEIVVPCLFQTSCCLLLFCFNYSYIVDFLQLDK